MDWEACTFSFNKTYGRQHCFPDGYHQVYVDSVQNYKPPKVEKSADDSLTSTLKAPLPR